MLEDDVAGRDFELLGGERPGPCGSPPCAPIANAPPWLISEREPKLPVPTSGGPSGSLSRNVIVSGASPRISATTSGNTVSWPWPEGPDRVKSSQLPAASKRIAISSWPTPPEGSMNTAQPMPRSLPARFAPRRAALETVPVRRLQDLRQEALRIAAVVGRAGRRLVGERILGQQIAPPELDAVDAGEARCFVDQTLLK